mmetsp:Transcript_124731/g.216215  ORF Transcript_124731/g.216215 Transcript_124731/m.216215 type:complete len:144 (+) Transcript_124731:91-522(+)
MGKGGKSRGGGGGQWVFMPTSAFSSGGNFSKWGKGGKGGKGGRRNIGMVRRCAKTQPERVAWIGGLPEKDKDKDLNKKLQEWINKLASGCKFVDIGPKGSGGAIFGTDDEASEAISTLNGKKFQGKVLEFDVYVKGYKFEDEE